MCHQQKSPPTKFLRHFRRSCTNWERYDIFDDKQWTPERKAVGVHLGEESPDSVVEKILYIALKCPCMYKVCSRAK